jgi:hypothetical protein
LEQLNQIAQKSTAATDNRVGMQDDAMTATQSLNMSNSVNTRFSLYDKHFSWSEKRFWTQWYSLYKKHFKDKIDSKVVRVVSNSAVKWRELTRDNLISEIDPDISIESEVTTENKRIKKFQAITNFLNIAMMSPNTNKLITLREYGHISGLDNEDIDMMIPQTMDEIRANEENKILDKNKIAEVDPVDDDVLHLWVHTKALNTKATEAHLKSHQMNMMVKKAQAEAQAKMQAMMAQEQPQPTTPSQAGPQMEGNMSRTSQPIQPSQPILRQ